MTAEVGVWEEGCVCAYICAHMYIRAAQNTAGTNSRCIYDLGQIPSPFVSVSFLIWKNQKIGIPCFLLRERERGREGDLREHLSNRPSYD